MRVVAIVLALAAPGSAEAATFNVNSTADDVDATPGNGVCATAGGFCSLRAAIQEANALAGADIINLPAGTYVLNRGSGDDNAQNGDLDITADLTLTGAATRTTIVNGNALDRVFDVRNGTVAISGLTITNGNSGGNNGGGLRNEGGATLTLTDFAVTGCTGKDGGGIHNDNHITLLRVTLSGNTATGKGGGMYSSGGGNFNFLTNVTISGNNASSDGGGAEFDHVALLNCTITNNTSPNNAIRKGGSQPYTLKNVIIANNASPSQCSGGTITSLGYNICSDAGCSLTGPGDQPNTNPKLGALANNGGPTNTHMLLAGSPAINNGTSAGAPATDQRGTARPQGIAHDIGAVEAVVYAIRGTVFEDVNYGGGAGRDHATSSGSARSGARVELFDGSGNYVGFTTTDGSGDYRFDVIPATYTIRVVNSTVSSSRPGYVATLRSVQTFRTDASSGSAVAVTDRVGGEVPSKVDAGNGSTTLAALTTATTTAQSITTVVVSTADVNDVDFGFNFDTIVNVNDAGQGSIRQFILNSNALTGEGSLAQAGSRKTLAGANEALPSGTESSIFMISDGLAHAGLRAGLANLLDGNGVAVLVPATALDQVVGSKTSLDGTTQAVNVGNTNTAVLGTGGTVGTDAIALSQVAGPEVTIRDVASLATGFHVQANDVTVRGMAIVGFGTGATNAGILLDAGFTGGLIEGNILGTAAHSFTDPGSGFRNYISVMVDGADNGTIRNNLFGFADLRAIWLTNASTGWVVNGNELVDNGLISTSGDGLAINAASVASATGNRITGTSSQGYVVTGGAGNTFTNNTVSGNGVGLTTGNTESAGITMRTGTSGTVLDRNVISANYGAGIQVNDGATGTRLTANSFLDNGTIVARNGGGPTGQIGVDLNSPTDDINLGTAPFFTLNDSGDGDTGGNTLFNFPVLETALVGGGNLLVKGFARPGSKLEFFISDGDTSGFGEGETYLFSATEGSGSDTDAGTGTYGPGPVNGIIQGTDTTNRFAFVAPVPPSVTPGTLITATAEDGATNTSEFSAVVTVDASCTIAGKVFEDENYGGGAGRTLAASSGIVRPGARVELYDAGGAFATATVTDGAGAYLFDWLVPGTYYVRVVVGTVTSSRAGYTAAAAPVQTYRADASGGAAAPVTDQVGGTNPALTDPDNGGPGTVLDTTTYEFTAGLTGTAHSVARVVVSAAAALLGDR